MGGRVSFLASAILPLQASISFYGGNIAPALLPRVADLHAPILFFWAASINTSGRSKLAPSWTN